MRAETVRYIYLSIGWFFTALGFIGVILPILPTTPFLLLAAWAFGKSSPRLKDWLHNHPHFGKYLRDWFEHGAICLHAKIMALTLMGASLAYTVYKVDNIYAVSGAAITIFLVAAFIVTRPNGTSIHK